MKFSNVKYTDKITRRDYSKTKNVLEMPNLLDIQKNSFKRFIEIELEDLIKGLFPISSPREKYTINFKKIFFGETTTNEERCRFESTTYDVPLFLDVEMINNETGEVKNIKKVKGSPNGIFFGNIPLMTDQGTFIINGIEKFVISQIIRSPGAYILDKAQIKLTNSRKKIIENGVCELLPYRGTLALFDVNELKKTIQVSLRTNNGESALVYLATSLLKAYGLNESEIIEIYGENNHYIKNTLESDPYNRENIFEFLDIKQIRKDIETEISTSISDDDLINKGVAIDRKLRGLILSYIRIEEELHDKNNDSKLLKTKNEIIDKIITEKVAKDIVIELGISIKILDLIVVEENFCYQALFVYHFFSEIYYDLSSAGRYKVNRKLRLTERIFQRTLNEDLFDNHGKILLPKNTKILKKELDLIKQHSKNKDISTIKRVKISNIFNKFRNKLENIKDTVEFEKIDILNSTIFSENTTLIGSVETSFNSLTIGDLLSIISYAQCIDENIYFYDDIDHLGNKRLKLIHELLKNKLSTGIIRIAKSIREKLTIADGDFNNNQNDESNEVVEKKELSIKSIINPKPFQTIIKEFFNSYQLIQFIDQQNPLSELTNKRRISAMGPGGISREDPNLDIRDVHNSHYGRICPIETPEGMNIGLIISLASYAKIDENGFIKTPYRIVKNRIVSDEIEWLTPLRDDEYVIGDSSIEIDENNKIVPDLAPVRYRGTNQILSTNMIDYIDVSPKQVISIASSLIPFLENDDANRALMGANMQRQAVPLVKAKSPWVGTGTEFRIAFDSKNSIVSDFGGTVTHVDGKKITLSNENNESKTFNLVKYRKSNQNTCNNQTPLVHLNQEIKKGDVIANGPAMENGELALGRNVLVGFSTWSGYNFEDAIVLSERLVNEDVYTSIHIDEYKVQCLQTKNGDEEITNEIPNISSNSKKYLDEDGIIMIGAEVKEGDILVGKVTPKGQVDLQAEEKLLESIFGKKSKSLKDSSLRVPHGGEGIVVDIKRFKNTDENGVKLEDDVIEIVKVYIAQKRKIQVGDKMAGRHGNKGIVSKIVPLADMPFMEDGTPLDILLNPLGVPSRMNIGQILELHLGLCTLELGKKELLKIVYEKQGFLKIENQYGLDLNKSQKLYENIDKLIKSKNPSSFNDLVQKVKNNDLIIYLNKVGLNFDDIGFKVSTPVFDGVSINDLKETMNEAGIDWNKTNGKFKLRDGRTGDYLNGDISVGIMYMLKLDHMVDDKIHARSVGPYSKVTQQPLGGKSQNGGQRFGEMEVWALEAYGAAYNLHELLTIKSDDVRGRNITYNSIVKGNEVPFGGTPESFKLLTKQIQGLGLYIDITTDKGDVLDINNFISNEYDFDEKVTSNIDSLIDEVDDDEIFLEQIGL